MNNCGDIFENRPFRSFWFWGDKITTCLTDDEAVAICGIVNEPLPQQYWRSGKRGSSSPQSTALAHTHAMRYVRKHGLRSALDAAWDCWEQNPEGRTPAGTPPMPLSTNFSNSPDSSGSSSGEPPTGLPARVGDTAALFRLMAQTGEEHKELRLLFRVHTRTFALTRFGDGSEFVQIYEGRRPSQRGLMGALRASGELLPSRAEPFSDAVLTALRQILDDPVAAAVAYGRAFGECSFCGRKLIDARSMHVGYGPVCAASFGLPWGDVETGEEV